MEVADDTASPSEATPITTYIPSLRVMRPSQTSEESESITLASADEDFTRLAKARSVGQGSFASTKLTNFKHPL